MKAFIDCWKSFLKPKIYTLLVKSKENLSFKEKGLCLLEVGAGLDSYHI